MFSRIVVLFVLWATAVFTACTPTPTVSAPTVLPTRTAVMELDTAVPATQTPLPPTPTPAPTATALFANLDLISPGWIHTIERHSNGATVALDPETWQMVNLQTDFEWEQWQRLDDAGLVVERITITRDMDGRALQTSTYRDGISRNLTFNFSSADDSWPLPWTHPDFVWPPEVELVLAERVDALPPEVQALLDTEITDLACDPLREADEGGGNGRWEFNDIYTGWLDSLAAQAQEPTPRWLHIVTTHNQNEAAFPYDIETHPYPLDYTNDRWLWLNERGLVEKSVGMMRDTNGEVVMEGVQRDGRLYDFTLNQTHAFVPKRPSLDLNFMGNAGMFVSMQREMDADGEPAFAAGREQFIFTTCQSYNGGLPMMGDLPVAIVGNQIWLWVDAETGAILRTEWRYIDATGQSHLDWQEEITLLEFVEELPPDVQALLEREMGE